MKHLIVLPAYNEEHALPETIQSLQILPDDCELLVVNDGSIDRTHEVAESLVARSRLKMNVVHLATNCGIGAAVQTGYRFAKLKNKYRYVIQCDADGQHDPKYLLEMISTCDKEGYDLCVGSRFMLPSREGFQSTFVRRMGIRFFASLISFLAGQKVTDPTSGFRCAGPRAWQSFAESYPDDYPEPESLFWCSRNRLRVGEIPVKMKTRSGGESSIGTIQAAYYMMKVTFAILIDRIRKQELMK